MLHDQRLECELCECIYCVLVSTNFDILEERPMRVAVGFNGIWYGSKRHCRISDYILEEDS